MKRLDELALSARDRAAIDESARVIRAMVPVEGIILFGSKARGDDDPESDIDLLVLTGEPLSRPGKRAVRRALHAIEIERGVALSPLLVHADEWRSGLISVLPIHDEVEEQGAVV